MILKLYSYLYLFDVKKYNSIVTIYKIKTREESGKQKMKILKRIEEMIKKKNYNYKDESNKCIISSEQACTIAFMPENLEQDYLKRQKSCISYLNFRSAEVKMIKKANRLYWMIQIVQGDISGVSTTIFGEETYWDGELDITNTKKLRCLIDAKTGEYKYYPKCII